MANTYLQKRVNAFHERLGEPPPPEIPRDLDWEERKLHARVCAEEFSELIVALVGRDRARELFDEMVEKVVLKRGHMMSGELPEIVDAVIDSEFVAAGVLYRAGVEDQAFLDEVCDANEEKVGGGRDSNGKFMKPAGWQPPRIEWLLSTYGWEQ